MSAKANKVPMFTCQECGKSFFTVKAAERAQNDGCPKCGGSDIDEAAFVSTSFLTVQA